MQNEPQMKSKCCNASMFVHSGKEGTNYYICNKCKKATDPVGGYSWEKHSTGEPQLSAEMSNDWKKYGRKKPYTEIGIERLPCFRCGEPAYHQWQICADNNLYRPVCLECDIELNEMVLQWFGFSFEEVVIKIERYKERQ